MWLSYNDILDRIPEPPLWWLRGVPRYKPFTPSSATIGGDQVLLAEIECQACRERFTVGLYPREAGVQYRRELEETNDLVGREDPPRHNCGGDTMTATPVRILEFWERIWPAREWRRVKEFERKLPD